MKLWRHAKLATLAADLGWGLIDDGALLVREGRIDWVGPDAELPRGIDAEEHDCQGALLTPGLIDCHTHLVYGGQRANEFELRLQGVSYEEIAKQGGGIRSSVAATRAASEEALFASAAARARALMAEGVTTLEVKSGYGL
ncbi:MAG TPA: imidazolonepropionase, partial [Burkholderiaceae bacterium]